MRVAVNLTWLVPGQVGGSEEATTALLGAILDRTGGGSPDAGIALHLLVAPSFVEAYPDLVARCEHSISPTPNRSRLRRVLSDNTWLRRAVGSAEADLVHHAGGVVPPAVTARCTLTVHDIQPLDHPEHFSAAKRWYLGALLGRSVRRAVRVAVPSVAVRERLVAKLGADASRVDVVPWPVPATPGSGEAESPAVVEEMGVNAPFLLYPAIAYPHKRHELLVEAWVAARRRGVDVDLVLTGRPGPRLDAAVHLAAGAGMAPHLHVLGRVPRPTLDALYRGAEATVFTSAYEGFGLPVAESLQRGTAVVAAPLPAYDPLMPGILAVDDDSPQAWADAIVELLDDPALRRRLVDQGRDAVSALTPERSAAAQIASWRHAVEGATP